MLVLFSAFDSHADIYKQISEDGVIVFSNAGSGKNSKIVVREKKAAPEGDKYTFPGYSGEPFREVVEEKAKHYNVDPQLVNAVIRTESNWNPAAVSPKGALGLMQLMPSTAAILGVTNPFDPIENIDGGVRYIGNLIQRFNGNLILALAAYNAGPGLVEKKGVVPSIPETVSYVRKVMQYYDSATGSAFNAREIGREVKKEFVRMKKIILEDGTLLFTNTYNGVAKSY